MGVIKIAPSEIRFSQDSIYNTFGDNTFHAGQFIGETLDDIVRDPDTVDRIPNISVFNIRGKWFTSDNRRLWVFQKAEELSIVRSIDVSVKHEICYPKFTTTSDGRYVRIHENNPGGHLWQSLQRQMIEKQAREHKRRVMKKQMEIERQQREWEEEMETERQQREWEEEMEAERQQREWEEEMETERQRREWEEEEEIERERQQRMWEDEEDEEEMGTWIIIIVVLLLLFQYWETSN